MSDSKGGGGGGMGGMNMVTTAMAFSVSAFFVLFVFTRLLCARLHLSRAAAADDRAAGDAFVVSAYNVRRPPPLPLLLPHIIRVILFHDCDSCWESTSIQVERGIHGLEPSVVTTFPTVKLGDGGPQRPPVQEAQ